MSSPYIEASKHPQGTQDVQNHFGMQAAGITAPTPASQAPIGNGLANQARQVIQGRAGQINKQIEDAGG